MAYRLTNTDKWGDAWFTKLKPMEKLLFNYLTDNCDIAGFIELNIKRWASDIGTDKRIIEGALKGLQRGLIYSNTNDCIYLRNFLKHQKNLPINEKNLAHVGILRRFTLYSYKFNITNPIEFIEAGCKGVQSPLGIGISIGNGLSNGNGEDKKPKINKKFIPPSLDEVKLYFKENGYNEQMAVKAFNSYNVADWHDSKGKQVLNWKQKMINVWFTEENRIKVYEDPVDKTIRELKELRERDKKNGN